MTYYFWLGFDGECVGIEDDGWITVYPELK
jgi:hypothetical protein